MCGSICINVLLRHYLIEYRLFCGVSCDDSRYFEVHNETSRAVQKTHSCTVGVTVVEAEVRESKLIDGTST